MNGPGQPTKYKPEYCDAVVEMAERGMSVAEWAAALGVAKATLWHWAGDHEEFLNAFTRAKTIEQAVMEKMAFENFGNKNFNSNLWVKSAQARFREDYTERRELEHSGLPEPQITRIERVIIDARTPDEQEIIPRYDAKLIENKKE